MTETTQHKKCSVRNFDAYGIEYESPLERIFAVEALKYLHPDAVFHAQYPATTPWGSFRLDFAVAHEGRLVGIECDGKEFHDNSRDHWRDAVILGATDLGAIYRLRGTDAFKYLHNWLLLLSRCEPALFSERGRKNLFALADPPIRDVLQPEQEFWWHEGLRNPYSGERDDALLFDRRCLEDENEKLWRERYAFAEKHGPAPLDDVIAADAATSKWRSDC